MVESCSQDATIVDYVNIEAVHVAVADYHVHAFRDVMFPLLFFESGDFH